MSELVVSPFIDSKQKRHEDIRDSFLLLPFSTIGSLGIMAALAIVDRDWPLYLDTRVGQKGRHIKFPKARTLPGVRESVVSPHGYNDVRASQLGKALRKSHLDELMQGPGVLLGRGSVVSPRPRSVPDYTETRNSLPTAKIRNEFDTVNAVCKWGLMMAYCATQHRPDMVFDRETTAMMDIGYLKRASSLVDNATRIYVASAVLLDLTKVNLGDNFTASLYDARQVSGDFLYRELL